MSMFFKKIASALGLPAELISNGAFDSVTTGWVAVAATLASVGSGQSGNCLEITRVSGTVQSATQLIAITPGRTYLLSGYVHNGSAGAVGFSINTDLLDQSFPTSQGQTVPYIGIRGTSSSSWVQYTKLFVCPPNVHNITISLNKLGSDAGTLLFDTISLQDQRMFTVRARHLVFQANYLPTWDRTFDILGSINGVDYLSLGLVWRTSGYLAFAQYDGLLANIQLSVSGGSAGTVDVWIGGRE